MSTSSLPLWTFEAIAQSGDCLLWKGTSPISRLIRCWTEFSHASLLVRLQECPSKLYLVEAVLPEVELRDARKRIQETSDEVYYFRPKWLTEEMRHCLTESAVDAVATGIRYDIEGLLRNALGYVSLDAKAYFCSELVWDLWKKCGLAPEWVITAPRPGDIPKRIQGDLFKICRGKTV